MDLPHGGFITVIQNAMERARLTAGVDKLLPVRIVKYANGRLSAVDDYSGWSAELGAFGSDNRAAFERLMSQN
jgi:putative photosynthetic complex assembly protein